MKLSPSTHRLLVATLYFFLFVFFILSRIPTGFGSGLMLGLDVTGLTTLGIAAIHSVTVNVLKLKNDHSPSNSADNKQLIPTSSKHALVFPITHSTSAICYLLMDALSANTAPEIRFTRMSGVLLWLNYAVSQLFFAIKDLSLQPISHRPLLNFLFEIDFLVGGLLVTATNLLQRPMPLALTSNGCWLAAGVLDICRTYQEWRKQVSTNITNPSAVQLPKPKSSVSIEVLDESRPQPEIKKMANSLK